MEKDKNLARGKRTLEDLGWGIKKPRVDLIDETEIATDDGELSMDEGSSQNTITAETASSNSNDTDSVISTLGNIVSFCTSDPATWRHLSSGDRESIARNGPPKNPSSFPHDTKGRTLPESIFTKTLPNGETVSRDWLVWSQSKLALFCFPCCLFNKHSTLEQQASLSKLARPDAGITNNWRKLYTKIHSHECNSAHLSRYCDWKALEKSLQKCSGIDSALQKQIVEQISQWREILKCILDVVFFLAEHNLPFRGHSSKIGDPDSGLFLSALELLGKHNRVLALHLQKVKMHQEESSSRMQAHYLSWGSQNEFIQICAQLVKSKIVEEVTNAIYYSIIVDGTPDASHTEQITFILRYVHFVDHSWKIEERFLQYQDCEKKKGCDIAELICQVLEENKICLKNCRGQGYDNGANMSGVYKGVQAIILQKNSCAVYSPCSAHSLNLCGVHAVESSNKIKSFLGNIQKLFNLFSSSPARWKILQDTASVSLHRLSDTRWSARIDAIKPLIKRPREVLLSLTKLQEHLDLPADISNEVDSLINWMKTFEFVLMATIWFKLLQNINDVNVLLQKSNITLDEETVLIKNLLSDLQRIRDSWEAILHETRLVAKNLGWEENFREKRHRRVTSVYGESTTAAYEHETEEDAFKVNVFYVALDTLIHEIDSRFAAMNSINEMFSFIWKFENDSKDKAIKLCEHYPTDLNSDDFVEEIRHLSNVGNCLFGEITSFQLLNAIYSKGIENIFPQVCIALRIFVSIPVSVAGGERSFSKLSLVKSCIRSTMLQERLSALVMLSAERELAKTLDYNDIINSFAVQKSRKALLQ
ncbi:MAG: DUF4371 domain-containing protein [Acidobacteria bacterium]|nr:DUF4371 domain-containing protein [Acidobacteriota bacterium]